MSLDGITPIDPLPSNKNDGPNELEQRLMQIKTTNRSFQDKLSVAELILEWFNDPLKIVVEGDIDSGKQIAMRIQEADYFHVCELLGLPTDSTPGERLDAEIDQMTEDDAPDFNPDEGLPGFLGDND